MSLAECVRRPVITTTPDTDLADAAEKMRREHVGLLVVVDAKRHPIGVLSDRDIVVQVCNADIRPQTLTVRDVMTVRPAVVYVEEKIEDVTERMRCVGVRRLPVIDRDGVLVGIIAADDVLAYLATLMDDVASITERERSTERKMRREAAECIG